MMDRLDLLNAYISFDSFSKMVEDLMAILEILPDTDQAVAILALEGLYRIERYVVSHQFCPSEKIKEFLRKWRCESPMYQTYEGTFDGVPRFLRSLIIFKTLKVPLFIDNYGKKELLSSYESIEDIGIDGETPIYHVTHSEEAKKIVEEKRLKPSDNKNIIEGCWFGQLDNGCSIYGSHAFETTLSLLGITRLHQGEIVSYKKEVNVILYAADDGELEEFSGLKKPELTNEEVASGAYVKVSIFVPSTFLPNTDDDFDEVVSGPIKVKHRPFCVKAERSLGEQFCCNELDAIDVDDLIAILADTDPAVAVLALEGLYRIEGDVAGGQFREPPREKSKELLRKWRCESPLHCAYDVLSGPRVIRFLRSLTIFKTLEVPLFIDNYGKKELLSSYESIEDIDINGGTSIYHVTHSEEAEKIVEEKRLKPSDNKNIIEGCWFGQLDNDDCPSVYGSKAFQTTLSLLGITRLHQGEIVSYKNEVNVILYAADDGKGFSGLKKPTLTNEEVENGAYVKVSIFVPARFLPKTKNDFRNAVTGHKGVKHGPFCVKAKRSGKKFRCKELSQ